jgi:hypothetical protein
MTVFVPVYRCGAALDFHQVPFSAPASRCVGALVTQKTVYLAIGTVNY